ncbi:MAG: lysophospholipase [Deltaproteobacteria bacterium]|nr:lysophospholipase [Deltaproteobacteria bacterium]
MKVEGPTHHFFKTRDGQELYFQKYLPEKPKGILIVVHGLAEHSGRYQYLVDYFAKRGWALYLMDQRGHGRSPGPRWYAPHFEDLVDDLEAFVEEVRRLEPKLPHFLIAHSFGGQVTVNFLARQPKGLSGVILSAPNLKIAMPVSALKKVFGHLASRFLPSFLIPNDLDATWISHDPEVVRAYEKDPLVGHQISLKLGIAILANVEKVMGLAPKINLPILLLHGEADKITSIEGTRRFFEKVASKDKQLKTYPGFYHEIFNEVERAEVFADVDHWLEKRLPK